jgi:branched-chain amino acid transport system ATP-binding protein
MALEVRGLVKHFGGVAAVREVSFDVLPGECVALIGPNGAGKSTTFACIAGQHPLTAGDVRWCGNVLNHLTPSQRLRLGVARTFQVARVFETLLVLQNVQVALQTQGNLAAWNDLNQSFRATALALLRRVGLLDSATRLARDLPYGAKKRLELAIALAGLESAQGHALLLLDEPAAGLAPTERADLMHLVQSLVRPGAGSEFQTQPRSAGSRLAVLYTEHNMDAVFGVADRVLVLIDGELAAQGTPQAVAQNPLVRSRYLGSARLAGLEGLDA